MISAAVAMTLATTMSYGAGLGKLKVSSGLGEPLVAEIELLSVTPEEMSGLTAEIASAAAYEAQGIERTSAANSVRVQTSKRADGTPILKLTSAQPVTDPFLDMLVQVDWASGRILREYTILLDPPAEIAVAPKTRITLPEINNNSFDNSSVAAQSGNTATVVEPASMSASEKKSSKRGKKVKSDEEKLAIAKAEAIAAEKSSQKASEKSTEQPAEQLANNQESNTQTELTTQRGDTLGKIARENMPAGVNLDQMLIALYKANKNAFDGSNINRLKVGKIIRVPVLDEIDATSKQDAKKAVAVQTQDWNAYRDALSGIVADAPTSTDTAENKANENQAGAGKITTAVDQSAKPVEPTQDVVKLSKNDTSSKTAKTNTQVADAKSENKTAATNAAKEADIKAQMLDKNVKDMKALKELTELKNKTLADAQNAAKLAEAAKLAAAISSKPTNAKPEELKLQELKVEDSKKDASKLEELKVDLGSEASTEPTPQDTQPASTIDATKSADLAAVKPKVNTPVIEVQPPPPTLLETVTSPDNLPLVGGGFGLLALIGGGWLFMRNRRKNNIAGFEHSIMTGGGLRGNTVFGNTGGATVDTGDTSFLTDFTNNPGGIIDTNEVDPIAEAEVYMAYGRENQAEEILKDAIVKEPVRYELHLKLLEILAGRNDSSAFEAIAGELYSSLGTDDPVWKKVAEMGIAMEPNNPLYKTTTATNEVGSQFNSTSRNLALSDFDQTQILTSNSLDFSLDDDAQVTNLSATDNSLDFEFDDDKSLSPNEVVSTELVDFGDNDNEISFDMPEKSDLDLSFDMPTMDLSTNSAEIVEFDSAPTLTMPESLEMAELKDNNSNFGDLTLDLDNVSAETSETVPVNRFENVDSAIDFNFDDSPNFGELTQLDEKSEIDGLTSLNTLDDNSEQAADKDLSPSSLNSGFGEISFDLDDKPAELTTTIATEMPEVDTKLDLIAAYIEMDDKEGAKELLEEVLKEGGVAQRAKAKTLLDSLN